MNTIFQISNILLATGILNSTELSIISDPLSYLPPACSSLINPSSLGQLAPSISKFDGFAGQAFLIGGGECAIEITALVTQMYNAINVLGSISPSIYQAIGVSKSTLQVMYTQWLSYTDGYALVTSWTWPSASVPDYQSAGLCINQDNLKPGSLSSCWTVTKVNGVYQSNRSYLLDKLLLSQTNFNLTKATSLDA